MPTEGETSTTNLEQPSDASPKHGATDDNVPDHNEDNIVYPGFNAQQSATLELMDRQCSKMISKIYLAQANYENQLQKFHDVVGKDIQDQVSQLYQENPFKLETSEDDSRLLRCFAENVLRKAQYQGSRLQVL